MSDDYLKMIPKDAHHVPPADRHANAIEYLEQLFSEGEDCTAEVYDAVQFIDLDPGSRLCLRYDAPAHTDIGVLDGTILIGAQDAKAGRNPPAHVRSQNIHCMLLRSAPERGGRARAVGAGGMRVSVRAWV